MSFNRLCRVAVLLASTGALGFGSNFSFTGTFSKDDQLEIFKFVSTGGTATMKTWGYAGSDGGTNAAGQTILAGGFDPILSLFGPGLTLNTAPLIAQNPDDPGALPDPVTNNRFDSKITISLLPGTYWLALSENDNQANGPLYANGFSEQGNGNFTSGSFGPNDGSPFWEVDFFERNGSWAVDITGNVTAAVDTSVPEPRYSFFIGAAFLCGWFICARRLRQQS